MKQAFVYLITCLVAACLIFAGAAYYKNNQTQSEKTEKQTDLDALRNAKLKYSVFHERAEKAKKRGDHLAAKQEYRQAIDVLEADFKKTKSKPLAAFIFDILNRPNIGLNDPETLLYYARNMDKKRLESAAENIIQIMWENPSVLSLDDLDFLCDINTKSLAAGDLKITSNVLRVLKKAQRKKIKIKQCAGQTYESLTHQIIGISPDDLTRRSDADLSLILSYAHFDLSGPEREDYFETYLPAFLSRKTYSPHLSRRLIAAVDSFGTGPQRKQLLDVIKKTEPKTGYHYFAMAQFYRSRHLDAPDYEMSRRMYEKSIDMGYRDAGAILNLFHMKYLGLGGPVDKQGADEALQLALDLESPEARIIQTCLTLKTMTKGQLRPDLKERFETLTWTVNGRALKAFAVYWGVIEDISPTEAVHLMEDTALDGSDWGVAGMAVFNEVGFGINQNLELAEIWRQQIGQSQEDIPILSLPIEDCEPQMGL